MDQDRLPPQSLEAEQAVLGAILLQNEAIHRALEILRPDDFYRPEHHRIFRAMVELSEAQGAEEAIDLVTLTDLLKRKGDLEQIGGATYLSSLASSVPTAANVAYHAKVIREKAVLRNLIQTATEIARIGYEGTETAEQLLDYAERSVFGISDQRIQTSLTSMDALMKTTFDSIERLLEGKGLTGLPTGFTDLDALTLGLQPGNLVIVAGRPSMGKTAFALNIAAHVATRRYGTVAIFSLEMSELELGLRMLCAEARVDLHRLRSRRLGREEMPKLTGAAGRLSEGSCFIDDAPQLSVLELRAKARRAKAKHDLQLIIVDYLQLMRGRPDAERREQEISEISRGLKALAKELNIPVIAVSQLSRAVEHRERRKPMLADLRESGAIEQDADMVLFLYRDELYNPDTTEKGKCEVIIAKQRNGPTGSVELAFLAPYTRFEDLARQERA